MIIFHSFILFSAAIFQAERRRGGRPLMQNNLQMNWFFRGRGGRKTKEGEEKEECRWGFCGETFSGRSRRLDSRDDERGPTQAWPSGISRHCTALVRVPVIRGQLDPRLFEGELYHTTPFRHSGSEP